MIGELFGIFLGGLLKKIKKIEKIKSMSMAPYRKIELYLNKQCSLLGSCTDLTYT